MAGYAEINEKLGLLTASVDAINCDISEIKRSLNGNGKPGLIDDHNNLSKQFAIMNLQFSQHLENTSAEKSAKEKAEGELKEGKRAKQNRKWDWIKSIAILIIGQIFGVLFAHFIP
jgi:hypothetical protein